MNKDSIESKHESNLRYVKKSTRHQSVIHLIRNTTGAKVNSHCKSYSKMQDGSHKINRIIQNKYMSTTTATGMDQNTVSSPTSNHSIQVFKPMIQRRNMIKFKSQMTNIVPPSSHRNKIETFI